MGQQVRVSRDLMFQGVANHTANVMGNLRFEKFWVYDDFWGDAIDARWVPSGDNGGTEAITAGSGGTVTLTTGATSEDRSILAGGINYYCAKNPAMFAALKVDNITHVCINMGFNDAATEANDNLAIEIAGTTITDRCTNGVHWVFDTDATSDYWYYCNSKAGTEGGTAHGTNAPVNGVYVTLGVSLDSDGDATFWYNGEQVGYKASATTAGTGLCPFFGVMARTTAARVLTVDYVYVFQDR